MKRKYARIVLDLPVPGPFDYLVPGCLRQEIEAGKRVWVSFGQQKRIGYCVGLSEKTESSYTKEIISVLDAQPLFEKRFLSFLKQLAELYFSTWGEMIASALPICLRKRKHPTDAKPLMINIRNADSSEEKMRIKSSVFTEVKEIIHSIEESLPGNFLLFDDYIQTKRTAIFLGLAKLVLGKDKDVLIIVPHLSKGEEIAGFLKQELKDRVLLYHSGLGEKEQFRNWRMMQDASAKVIVGTRIAVYHPKQSIGLIIVEDEGSSGHKQDESPFYNAREVALRRARYFKIPIVLCGPPILLDSYYKAEKKKFILIDLRHSSRQMPLIHLVDLRRDRSGANYKRYISRQLEFKIAHALSEDKKIVLFLNRRGFSTLIKCLKCARVIECSRCQQNLTYHFELKRLICHRCGYSREFLRLCPYCNSSYLRYRGMGTEKLESELSRLFPQAKIERLDTDVKKDKGRVEAVLRDFEKRGSNILIGTNLLTKELTSFAIGFLGMINLEQGMNFPDFRGSEKLFWLLIALLKLVYSDKSRGELLIQTYNPGSLVIRALMKLDYSLLYREELLSRRELRLPPFRNLVILNLRGKNKKLVRDNADELCGLLKEANLDKTLFISEAVPNPLYKLRGKFRWQIFIKSKNVKSVYRLLREVLGTKRGFKGNILTVDLEFC